MRFGVTARHVGTRSRRLRSSRGAPRAGCQGLRSSGGAPRAGRHGLRSNREARGTQVQTASEFERSPRAGCQGLRGSGGAPQPGSQGLRSSNEAPGTQAQALRSNREARGTKVRRLRSSREAPGSWCQGLRSSRGAPGTWVPTRPVVARPWTLAARKTGVLPHWSPSRCFRGDCLRGIRRSMNGDMRQKRVRSARLSYRHGDGLRDYRTRKRGPFGWR